MCWSDPTRWPPTAHTQPNTDVRYMQGTMNSDMLDGRIIAALQLITPSAAVTRSSSIKELIMKSDAIGYSCCDAGLVVVDARELET